MKRKAADSGTVPQAKRQQIPAADYCDVISRKDEQGNAIWPASIEAIENARSFLREWYRTVGTLYSLSILANCSAPSAASQSKTLIVPDKDADGFDAGVILRKTLLALGLSPEHVEVHLIGKNSNVHDQVERTAMQAKKPKYIIIVDQGSQAAPPVIESDDTKSLIIDHHLSDEFPKGATVLLSALP